MALKVIESIIGIFDDVTGRLAAISPAGTSDVSYIPTSDTPLAGAPVMAKTDSVTGRIEKYANGELVSAGYPERYWYKGGMLKFKAAKSRNGAPPRVLIQGHSHVVGLGAGTGTNALVGAREKSWPVVMAKALGWQTGSFVGDGGVKQVGGVLLSAYDPRITLGAWQSEPDGWQIGGAWLTTTTQNGTALKFIPECPFDTIVFRYPTVSYGATAVQIIVDGVVVQTISQAASLGYASTKVTVPNGLHTVEIKMTGTGTAYCSAIETYDSTNKAPVLLQAGRCGAGISTLANVSGPLEWGAMAVAIAPDAVVTQCIINAPEVVNCAYSISQIAANMYAAGADVINTIEFPEDTATGTDGTIETSAQTFLGCASAYSGAFVDTRAVAGAIYATAVSKGLMYDTKHPNAVGYAEEAAIMGTVF